MHIALIGTRGVPAAYGGFETAVEEVGRRLVTAGHEVTVYCRGRDVDTPDYLGMRTVDLPAIHHRAAETLSHTLLSVLHTIIAGQPDVAIVFNAANSPFLPLLRAAKIPCALHTDGLEWLRGKWGPVGQRYYLLAEALGVRFADTLISDADAIAYYYYNRYRATSTVIRYGAPIINPPTEPLKKIGLVPGRYHLVVARLEPENNVDLVMRGHLSSAAELPLVVVGSVPYPTSYAGELERLVRNSNDRIRPLGSVWDQDLLDALYAHSSVYLHGHSVGGTNPSLLRAMGAGAPIAAYDVPFNREVLASDEAAYWRDPKDVVAILADVERHPQAWRVRAEQSQNRAAVAYRWDEVAKLYGDLAENLLSPSRKARAPRPVSLSQALRSITVSRSRDPQTIAALASRSAGQSIDRRIKQTAQLRVPDPNVALVP